MNLTYSSYLRLPELLSLQTPLSEGPEHDEMLFIVIHQAYELWFKEILHEVSHAQELLAANDSASALHTLGRIRTILKVLVAQVDILETMTPQEFLSFRHRLGSSSGFQSLQFRALEFALGYRRSQVLLAFASDAKATALLQAIADRESLWDSFLTLLQRRGYAIPHATKDPMASTESSPAVQAVLLHIYAEKSPLQALCERLTDIDEGLQEWRYRHVKMVERVIGMKAGTGGSSGAAYLRGTLFKPLFPDLWAIRSEIGVQPTL